MYIAEFQKKCEPSDTGDSAWQYVCSKFFFFRKWRYFGKNAHRVIQAMGPSALAFEKLSVMQVCLHLF